MAVIGMSGRFPGAADLESFWSHLEANADLITEVPPERWDWRSIYGDPHEEPGKTKAKWGGFMSGADQFEPLFFGIAPGEAESMDPQFRLFMEAVWGAIEEAGYPAGALAGTRTGVFAGVSTTDYRDLCQRADVDPAAGNPRGSYAFMLANRVSHWLDVRGPSEAIDTACSSSLVAIHRALESLRAGQCEMALVGGVNVMASPHVAVAASEAGMLSGDGRCKAFDSRADGYVRGEGVGVLWLKPLRRAVEDCDRIHGLIRGSAENHGGRAASPTAPNPVAQQALLVDAYHRAGVDPRAVGYIEAHGTGTELGDPIEADGLKGAFAELCRRAALPPVSEPYCAIGSVKANIGHLEAAAGMAGVIKVLLMLRHGKIPGNPHLRRPNPYLRLEGSAFFLARETCEWPPPAGAGGGGAGARLAGVSGFGIGGANAHVILEEHLGGAPALAPAVAPGPVLIVLSARDEGRLAAVVREFLVFLRGLPEAQLPPVAYSLQVGREAMEERLGLVVGSAAELAGKLERFLAGESPIELLFRGRAQGSDEALEAFAADEDLARAVEAWIEKRKYAKLADLWVRGMDLDWKRLYGGRRYGRVALPGYPFARERYWIAAPSGAGARGSGAGGGHPLVHENASDLAGQRFRAAFTGGEPFLADHRVGGRKVLPAAAYLEMAREAVCRAWPGSIPSGAPFGLGNVAWARPLVFEGAPLPVHIGLERESSGKVRFEVFTEAADGERRVHCAGGGGFGPEGAPGALETLDLAALQALISAHRLDSEECRRGFAEAGIQYGPAHRALERLWAGQGQALGRLVLPAGVVEEGYGLHPSLLDGALQASVGLLFSGGGAPGAGVRWPRRPMLPFALESLEFLGPLSRSMWAWVRPSSSPSDPPGLRRCDIDLCDDAGAVALRLRGFCSRAAGPEEGDLWLGQAVWQAAAAAGPEEDWGFADHVVLVWDSARWSGAQLAGVRHRGLSSPAERLPERFEDLAGQAFEAVKGLLVDRPPGRVLVQVIASGGPEAGFARGVLGLLRTARAENPDLIGQVVELDSQAAGEGLLGRLRQSGGRPSEDCVRYVKGVREVVAWEELPAAAAAAPCWREDGVYLITGGRGGLGMVFAREIAARTSSAALILLGRSAPGAEQRRQMEALEAAGARCFSYCVDVSRRDEVRDCLAEVVAEHGALHGVLHCAGVLRDGYLIKKGVDEFRSVLRPKVAGAVHLDEAWGGRELDFFVMFSSAAAIAGNPGQADYATANAFLDAFARRRERLVREGARKGKSLSVNWPLWAEGGMGIEGGAASRLLAERGLVPLRTQSGLQAFYRAVAGASPGVLVLEGDLERWGGSLVRRRGAEAVEAVEGRVEGGEEGGGGLRARTLEWIKGLLSKAVKLPPERIQAGRHFERYGIDSVLQMGIVKDLEKVVGEVPKTLLFEYTTAAGLAEYLLARHRPALAARWGRSNPAAPGLGAGAAPARSSFGGRPGGAPGALAAAEEVAVIGLSGRYPLSDSLEELWEHLKRGDNCITEADPERWRHSLRRAWPSSLRAPALGKAYYGGFLREIHRFDHRLFGIAEGEVRALPPELRLFLEIVWETFESAGYTRGSLEALQERSQRGVGVFVGTMYSQYAWARETLEEALASANGSDWQIPNRCSHIFNLTGPSIAVNSACSSSLTAVHLACESLRRSDCSMAVAGGINLTLDPSKFEVLAESKMLGSGKRSRSLGEGDGYLPGEGVGAVLLKPLSAALGDGDRIWAVIKSSFINHGGGNQAYPAPDPNQQARLIVESIERSGVDPETIGYVESAVNGSALGDPIEIRALKKAFGRFTDKPACCALGSVKSNIGHLEAASGISQLSKVILQFENRALVPSINADPPNPHVKLEGSPFRLQRAFEPWPAPRHPQTGEPLPRRSMINSFGVGGAYANVIVEAYEPPGPPPARAAGGPQESVLLLSAKTAASLMGYMDRLIGFIEAGKAPSLAGLARSLRRLNHGLDCRAAVVAASLEGALDKLRVLRATARARPAAGVFWAADSEAGAGGASGEELSGVRDPRELGRRWVAGAAVPLPEGGEGPAAPWHPLPSYAFDHSADFGPGAGARAANGRPDALLLEKILGGELSVDQFRRAVSGEGEAERDE
ncbi:MAG: Polyketide synthase PksN [Verrucomicrobia subdivision 3 bacterium]|nr:Polyketide synthase PksN [Limisphaerales bacterium]